MIKIPTSVNAFCIKSSGGANDLCVGMETCVVNNAIYCCDTSAECSTVADSFCSNFGSCKPNSYVCEQEFGQKNCQEGEKCGKDCSKSTGSLAYSDPTCLGGNGIDTAIGCIPVNDTNVFMGWILGWAIGIGGGIAFLLIIYASFMVMTSQGNPERLKAGQELLTSAISGLILLIFSVFILRFIGLDILGLGIFGFGQ